MVEKLRLRTIQDHVPKRAFLLASCQTDLQTVDENTELDMAVEPPPIPSPTSRQRPNKPTEPPNPILIANATDMVGIWLEVHVMYTADGRYSSVPEMNRYRCQSCQR